MRNDVPDEALDHRCGQYNQQLTIVSCSGLGVLHRRCRSRSQKYILIGELTNQYS